MSATDCSREIAAYQGGLDAEIAILRQLETLAAAQRDASALNDLDAMTRLGDERDRLLKGIAGIESEIRPIRERIASDLAGAAAEPGFATVVERHRTAGDLVSRIAASDAETARALRESEAERRFAAQVLDLGESTLSAYRRIVAPAPPGPAVVDQRG